MDDLPLELLFSIFSYFSDPSQKSTLISLSLVSHRFHSIAQSLLYHTILIRATSVEIALSDLSLHLSRLQTHLSLRYQVKKFVIYDPHNRRTFAWGSEKQRGEVWASINALLLLLKDSLVSLDLRTPDPPCHGIWKDILKAETCVPPLPHLKYLRIQPPFDVFRAPGGSDFIPYLSESRFRLMHLHLDHVTISNGLLQSTEWKLQSLILKKVFWDVQQALSWLDQSSNSLKYLSIDSDSLKGSVNDLLKVIEKYQDNLQSLSIQLYEESHELSIPRMLRIVPSLSALKSLTLASDSPSNSVIPFLEFLPNIAQSPLSKLSLERIPIRPSLLAPLHDGSEWRLRQLSLVGLKDKANDMETMKRLMVRTHDEDLMNRSNVNIRRVLHTEEAEKEFVDWLVNSKPSSL